MVMAMIILQPDPFGCLGVSACLGAYERWLRPSAPLVKGVASGGPSAWSEAEEVWS